ncbi:hypothetical protein HRF68_19695, partial [Pseudomonas stutzeri]|nr:hypothetical protein [Stutzerimonas stutzeri]
MNAVVGLHGDGQAGEVQGVIVDGVDPGLGQLDIGAVDLEVAVRIVKQRMGQWYLHIRITASKRRDNVADAEALFGNRIGNDADYRCDVV